MTRNKNYEDLMPGLFAELARASEIVVLLRGGCDLNLFTQVPDTELISVNGYETPQALGACLKRLGDQLIEKAMAIQSDFVPRERSEFLEQVAWQFKAVLDVVKPLPAKQLQDLTAGTIPGGLWIFREVRVGCEGEMLVSSAFPISLHIAARKFAAAWLRSARATLDRLKMLSLMVSFFPGRKDLAEKPDTEPKIILTDNVDVFAVMIRLMFECKVFATNNKAELCRLMCRSFGTTLAKNISFDHCKNSFDIPKPEILRYIISTLTLMVEMAMKLEERYQ